MLKQCPILQKKKEKPFLVTCVPPISLHFSTNPDRRSLLLPPRSHFPFSPHAILAQSHPLHAPMPQMLPWTQTQGAVPQFHLLNIYTEFHVVGDTHLLETLLLAGVFLLPISLRSLGWAILPNFPMFECPRVQVSVTSSTNLLTPSLKYHFIHTDDAGCSLSL